MRLFALSNLSRAGDIYVTFLFLFYLLFLYTTMGVRMFVEFRVCDLHRRVVYSNGTGYG